MLCWYKKSEWQEEHCARKNRMSFVGEGCRIWKPYFTWYPVTRIGYSPFGWFCWLKWIWRCESGFYDSRASYLYAEYPPSYEYLVNQKLPYFGNNEK